MKLKIILSALSVMLLCTLGALAETYDVPICINVNGSYIKSDVLPELLYDTTYLPIRCISEALECDVSWNETSSTAKIVRNDSIIEIPTGQSHVYVNGEKISLKLPTYIKNSRTMVPVRIVSESLGANVDWDSTYYTVHITDGASSVHEDLIDHTRPDNDSIFWLARIIESESAGEPMMGKIAVGNVVMNRVESNHFPNTIYGVIFDTAGGVQFEPVINGTIYNTPGRDSIIASKLCLGGENTAGDSLFFLNPRIASNLWIPNTRVHYITIGNHEFYL